MASDTDPLRPYWRPLALGQTKRVDARLSSLIEHARTNPAEALSAMAEIAVMVLEVAVRHHAEHVGTSPAVARIEALRDLGRRINQ